jgi:hypothetical protein
MEDEDEGILLPGQARDGKNDDDVGTNAAALFGTDVGDGSAAPIDLDDNGGIGATGTVNSNSSAPSVVGKGNVGKRKSLVCADFNEIFKNINGVSVCTKVVCKMCKATLSARSAVGAGHLKRHKNHA